MSTTSSNSTKDARAMSPWLRMLQAVPIRNEAAEVQEKAGQLLVTVRLKPIAFLFPPLSWLIRPRKQRKLLLDGVGRTVWQWCNGDANVEDLVDRFGEEFGFTFHESRLALSEYLKQLVERGAVVLVMSDPSERRE